MGNKMTFSCQNISSLAQFHTEIGKLLEFPDFYGKNWDAFWDAITGLVETHTASLQKISPKDFEILCQIVKDYNQFFANHEKSIVIY